LSSIVFKTVQMKLSILFIIIGLLGIFSSCQKIEDPQVQPIHRYTYYVRTNGNNVLLTYRDSTGKDHQEFINKTTWHKTYEAEVGASIMFKVLPLEDCFIECYFAQDGRKIGQSPWKQWYRLHGLKCEYVVKESMY